MNQRIKELAKQAGSSYGDAYDMYLLEEHIEKFAELIVKECAELLIENSDKQFNIRTVEPESHDKSTEWMAGYEEAVKQYGGFLLKKNARLIKKHFGVEE